MIELKPVNVKRFQLVKDRYVENMADCFEQITKKPRPVVEKYFTHSAKRLIGRKWELKHHHFREIIVMPEKKRIGLLWYRTHDGDMFSDVVMLQWLFTEVDEDLQIHGQEIIETFIDEIKQMGIKRVSIESYAENDKLKDIWEKLSFEPVRTIMHKYLD